MKDSAKNQLISSPPETFNNLLERSLRGEKPDGSRADFFLSDEEYQHRLSDFAREAHPCLKRLYFRFQIPPGEILELVSMCLFSDLPRQAPPLLSESRRRERSAAKIDEVANDLEEWSRIATPIYRIRSIPPDLSERLRTIAKDIRRVRMPKAGRRKDVVLHELANYLIDLFREHTGGPRYEDAACLLHAAFPDWKVGEPTDGIKKLVGRK